MEKNIIKKHSVVFAVILICLFVLTTYIPLHIPFGSIIIRIILCAILIFYLYKNDLLYILRFNLLDFKQSIISGILFLFFAIWVAVLNIIAYSSEFRISIAFWDFCFHVLMVGILEELCFRGLFINIYIKHREKVKSTIYKAVLLSSAFFGICHYLNMIDQPFMKTTAQVFGAFCLGVLFAAVYLKGMNIWVCALFHALWNFGNMYGSFLPDKNPEMYGIAGEMTLLQVASSMIEPAIILIIGVFILRNIHKEKYISCIFHIDNHLYIK